ncbi:MAG: GIY-YIG nuclease family protein [Halobacteriales archaeon]
MDEGTYSLVVDLVDDVEVDVGALGALYLPAGLYAYVGSARGPGGFARVDRHIGTLRGERSVTRWHVDYLSVDDAVRPRAVVRSDAGECDTAAATPGTPVDGFGCSDCACDSHLFGVDSVSDAVAGHSEATWLSVKSYGRRGSRRG